MNPEELQQLKELIGFLKENQISEFSLERGELKVQLSFQQEGAAPGTIDAATLGQLIHGLQSNASAGAALPVGSNPAASLQPIVHQLPSSEAAPLPAPEAEEAGLHTVKSPIVGTFYESPSPGASAFVKIGDRIESGQPLCIIEAMKLMNEIESDATGEIVKRLVSNGQAVEYGQPLFLIRPGA
jgi:acetyl-CoA carboxylase biotin carboxyl carrier protein